MKLHTFPNKLLRINVQDCQRTVVNLQGCYESSSLS